MTKSEMAAALNEKQAWLPGKGPSGSGSRYWPSRGR